jgi:protein TonB
VIDPNFKHALAQAGNRAARPPPKRQKLAAFLVTGDAELWPQIGGHLAQKLSYRQIDTVDELLTATAADQAAVIVWDARGNAEQSSVLSRLQAHSTRFAIIALDDATAEPSWTSAIQHLQIIALVPVPLDPERLAGALANAYEEVNARIALLGESTAPAKSAPAPGAPRKRVPRFVVAGGCALLACVAVVLYLRHGPGADVRPTAPSPAAAPPAAAPPAAAPPAAPSLAAPSLAAGPPTAAPPALQDEANEEKVDTLIEQAQRAMRDRHFIEPAEGSALSLYRSALVLDPASGEARQGLKRLSEILVARVQSALDERQFDAALQALETVRSIDPGDGRLPALDERIAKMRELGPAEIVAAMNAQNFDRAAQLIEEAAKSRSVAEPKLAQLREDLRRRRAESGVTELIARIDARLQQDQLLEPPNDSAAYYLSEARKAGAKPSALQSQFRELSRRLTQQVHAAIDQHRMADADRLTGELRAVGAPLSAVAELQHQIGAARADVAHQQSAESHLVDLARSRLAQGSVVSPENDNALYYLNQLRAADPQNAALAQLSGAIQTQILAQARTALDGAQLDQAESMLQLAAGLGSSADADALADRLRLAKSGSNGAPKEVAEASLTRTKKLEIDYPERALAQKIEGTVEIGFVVTPKGSVADVKVLDAHPKGVFEKAATNAVSRLKYKPVLEAGKAVAVATKMLVIFRLSS